MKILIVDDYRPFALSLKLMLTSQHQVTLAQSAREALSAIESSGFDIALVDLKLPDGDGLSLCRTLRERSAGLHLVVMTGGGSDATTDKQLTQLRARWLEKPFTPERLQGALAPLREA